MSADSRGPSGTGHDTARAAAQIAEAFNANVQPEAKPDCPACGGDGWYVGHEDECYDTGDCHCSGVQVECECGPSGTGHGTDDFVRFCCGDPDCPNDCERETPPGPASVSPAERRTRRSITDRELTQLQETGSVVIGHSMVDGIRLTAFTAALLFVGIDPEDVVLHGTGADHIAMTVKPDAR